MAPGSAGSAMPAYANAVTLAGNGVGGGSVGRRGRRGGLRGGEEPDPGRRWRRRRPWRARLGECAVAVCAQRSERRGELPPMTSSFSWPPCCAGRTGRVGRIGEVVGVGGFDGSDAAHGRSLMEKR